MIGVRLSIENFVGELFPTSRSSVSFWVPMNRMVGGLVTDFCHSGRHIVKGDFSHSGHYMCRAEMIRPLQHLGDLALARE